MSVRLVSQNRHPGTPISLDAVHLVLYSRRMTTNELPQFGELEEEIDFWMNGVEHEPGEEYTRRDALQDISSECDDPEEDATLKRQLRAYLVACGVYRPITEEQLSRMVVMGGRKYEFSIKGTKYVFDTWDNAR